MSTFKHVFNTWLLSHLFHPFLFWLGVKVRGESIDTEVIGIISIVGPIISIPSFLLCCFF
jgi:hypothetical protein